VVRFWTWKKQCTIRFENEEIRNIFTALGVTVGTAEDSKALNISKYVTIK
jgi:hypothetical protein